MEISLQQEHVKIIFTDFQIIEGIKKEESPKMTLYFQNQFYHKYKGYIYKVAIQRCVSYHDAEQLAIDITQETFISAFRGISKFDFPIEISQEKYEYVVKAWLGRIANNCFNKEYAKRKDIIYLDDLIIKPEDSKFDLFESLYGEEPIEVPNEFRRKLNLAMSLLSEEQKHIILTYANEGCLNNNLHLSSDAMVYLCKTYTTSSANIRQIKKRTLDKIKKHCFPESVNL